MGKLKRCLCAACKITKDRRKCQEKQREKRLEILAQVNEVKLENKENAIGTIFRKKSNFFCFAFFPKRPFGGRFVLIPEDFSFKDKTVLVVVEGKIVCVIQKC